MATEPVHILVEIPKGSRNKYEWDEELEAIKLDRYLFSSVVYPTDYGFIPDTLGAGRRPARRDGLRDRADVPGLRHPGQGDRAVPDDRRRRARTTRSCASRTTIPTGTRSSSLDDLPDRLQDEIEHFFSIYKQPEGKDVTVDGWYSREEALEEIERAREPLARPRRSDVVVGFGGTRAPGSSSERALRAALDARRAPRRELFGAADLDFPLYTPGVTPPDERVERFLGGAAPRGRDRHRVARLPRRRVRPGQERDRLGRGAARRRAALLRRPARRPDRRRRRLAGDGHDADRRCARSCTRCAAGRRRWAWRSTPPSPAPQTRGRSSSCSPRRWRRRAHCAAPAQRELQRRARRCSVALLGRAAAPR